MPEEQSEVIYMTDSDNSKDCHYFEMASSEFSKCIYRVLRSKSDILLFLLGDARKLAGQFQAICVANHTLSHFRLIIDRNPRAEIRSFDEGSGNFIRSGALHNDLRTRSERIRDTLLGIQPISETFRRSKVHFTVNAALENVVPKDRLREISLIASPMTANSGKPAINIVMGQPFDEYLDTAAISDLIKAFGALPSGRYFMHPREAPRYNIADNLQVIDKDPRILEHYVRDLVEEGHRVRLVGPLSTSFFTINSPAVTKHYLHRSNHDQHLTLAAKVGCEVFDLRLQAEQTRWRERAAEWTE